MKRLTRRQRAQARRACDGKVKHPDQTAAARHAMHLRKTGLPCRLLPVPALLGLACGAHTVAGPPIHRSQDEGREVVKSVYRYDVAISDTPTELTMPRSAKVRAVGVAASTRQSCVSIWAEVCADPGWPVDERRAFTVHGTGHPIEDESDPESYVGTVIDPRHNGDLVWHVFEVSP